MATYDETIKLTELLLAARRPYVALAATCPEWSPETAGQFHAARDKWLVENTSTLLSLGNAESIARRKLLLSLLRSELRLHEEPRDVSAYDGLEILGKLLADVLSSR